jgi:hypothetical protein
MLKIIEKTFGRQILVDVVDMATRLTPIGFETDRPNINYVRMPYGKYGVQVKGTEALDVVVRQDNVVVAQRRLEAGVVHLIHRGDDGGPLFFSAPGEKPKFVASDAGRPINISDGEAAAERGESLFPEEELALPYAESHGLIIVQVRFAHLKPDYGPELPPDDFTSILFQFNEPKAHLKAMSQNFGKVRRPDLLPPGANELGDQSNLIVPVQTQPTRVCAIACDRDHAHIR